LNLTWDYAEDQPKVLPDGTPSRIQDEPDPHKVLREINGYRTVDGQLLGQYQDLKDNGTTACGCWIYCGVYPEEGWNRARDRIANHADIVNPRWAWAWPGNRRMLYNRASADPEGKPWSERKKYLWWDAEQGKWTGLDQPDFEATKAPDYRPPDGAKGMAGISGDSPFILKPDGKGWLFASGGTKDGPLPTHYEPVESPLRNRLYRQQINPTARVCEQPLNPIASSDEAEEFPIVATTTRVTEHYLSGPMSRFNSWLNELQPAMFVELSPELAEERGITHGEWVIVYNKRGAIEARAMVTPRVPPLKINGRTVHQVILPIHFGWAGEIAGSQANDLTSIVLDANVSMHEGKAFTCQVRPGRLKEPSDVPSVAAVPRARSEPMPETPHQAQPEGRTA
jgi:formate dehydrogenase major subunit